MPGAPAGGPVPHRPHQPTPRSAAEGQGRRSRRACEGSLEAWRAPWSPQAAMEDGFTHKFCGRPEKFIIIEHAKRFPDPRGGPGLPNTRNLSGQTHPGAIAPCLPQTLPAPQSCPRSAAGRRAMSILSNRSSGATRRTGAHRLLARRVALSHRRVVQIEFDRPSLFQRLASSGNRILTSP